MMDLLIKPLKYMEISYGGKFDWGNSVVMEVCFWGAGKIGRQAVENYMEIGMRPEFIIDNNKEKIGGNIYGVPIISFADFLSRNNKGYKIVITTAAKYVHEIKKQLNDNGFVCDIYENDKKYGPLLNQHLRDNWVISKLVSITGGNRC